MSGQVKLGGRGSLQINWIGGGVWEIILPPMDLNGTSLTMFDAILQCILMVFYS